MKKSIAHETWRWLRRNGSQVEARLGSFAGVNAVLADGQLALHRKNPGGQYRFGLQQQAEEAAEIAQRLPSA